MSIKKLIEKGIGVYYKHQNILIILGIVFITIFSFGWFMRVTKPFGIGLTTDSVAYLWSAENLANGIGLGRLTGAGELKPMTHWPPLYPLILALMNKLGLDIFSAARWLGGICFSLAVFLTGWLLKKITRSFIFTIAALILLLVSSALWETGIRAMTEQLFMIFCLGGIFSVDRYWTGNQIRYLVFAAVLFGAGFLTRYAGISIIITVASLLLFKTGSSLIKKFVRSFLFGIGSSLPLGLWLGYNQIIYANATNRSFSIYPIPVTDFQELLRLLNQWIQPLFTTFHIGPGKLMIGTAILVIALAAVLLQVRLPQIQVKDRFPFLVQILLSFIPIYLVIVLLSRLYFDPMIDIWRERILFPGFLSVFIILIWGIQKLWNLSRKFHPGVSIILAILLVFAAQSFFSGFIRQSETVIQKSQSAGVGLAHSREDPPEIIVFLKSLPPADLYYTDNIERLYIYSGLNSYQLVDLTPETLNGLLTAFPGKRFVFVSFNNDLFDKLLLEASPAIERVFHDIDGSIYTTP